MTTTEREHLDADLPEDVDDDDAVPVAPVTPGPGAGPSDSQDA